VPTGRVRGAPDAAHPPWDARVRTRAGGVAPECPSRASGRRGARRQPPAESCARHDSNVRPLRLPSSARHRGCTRCPCVIFLSQATLVGHEAAHVLLHNELVAQRFCPIWKPTRIRQALLGASHSRSPRVVVLRAAPMDPPGADASASLLRGSRRSLTGSPPALECQAGQARLDVSTPLGAVGGRREVGRAVARRLGPFERTRGMPASVRVARANGYYSPESMLIVFVPWRTPGGRDGRSVEAGAIDADGRRVGARDEFADRRDCVGGVLGR
jgi:hypothetical protein